MAGNTSLGGLNSLTMASWRLPQVSSGLTALDPVNDWDDFDKRVRSVINQRDRKLADSLDDNITKNENDSVIIDEKDKVLLAENASAINAEVKNIRDGKDNIMKGTSTVPSVPKRRTNRPRAPKSKRVAPANLAEISECIEKSVEQKMREYEAEMGKQKISRKQRKDLKKIAKMEAIRQLPLDAVNGANGSAACPNKDTLARDDAIRSSRKVDKTKTSNNAATSIEVAKKTDDTPRSTKTEMKAAEGVKKHQKAKRNKTPKSEELKPEPPTVKAQEYVNSENKKEKKSSKAKEMSKKAAKKRKAEENDELHRRAEIFLQVHCAVREHDEMTDMAKNKKKIEELMMAKLEKNYKTADPIAMETTSAAASVGGKRMDENMNDISAQASTSVADAPKKKKTVFKRMKKAAARVFTLKSSRTT